MIKQIKNTVPSLVDEILQVISIERAVPKELGEPISSQLAEMALRFWKTEANSAVKLKQKETLKIQHNCGEIRAPILNDSISQSKKIHHYYIRTDKRLFDIQGEIITATSALLLTADRCLAADKNKSTVNYREIVTLQVDALTMLGDVSKKLTKLRKSQIKPAFGFEVKNICDKDFENSPLLFGDNISESIKQTKEEFRIAKQLTWPQTQNGYYSNSGYNAHTITSGYKRPYPQEFGRNQGRVSAGNYSLNFQGRKRKPQKKRNLQQDEETQIRNVLTSCVNKVSNLTDILPLLIEHFKTQIDNFEAG